jgi:diguanylate cyclase (GGDEF)-like protein
MDTQDNSHLDIERSHKKLLFKVFLPFFVGFVTILIAIFFSFDSIYRYYEIKKTTEMAEHISTMYHNKLQENNTLYNEIIEHLIADERIATYYQAKDRSSLYNYTKPLYIRLKKNFKVTHLYFHGIDRKVFLRVHNPSIHSDLINRETLLLAQKSGQNSFGIEFGIAHNLTSRSVFPYHINGNLVGYIELGEEIDYFTPYFSNIFHSDVLMAINKELIDIENIRLTSKLEQKVKKYPLTNRYYIINSTLPTISEKLKNLLDDPLQNKSFFIDMLDHTYKVICINLQDIHDKNVGKMFVLFDAKEEIATLQKLKFKVLSIIILIAVCIILIYFIYLRKVVLRLEQSTDAIIQLSITDQLTGLYNRHHFNEIGHKEVDRAIRCGCHITFMMLDLDNFKHYNDRFGHVAGDKLLQKIAQTLNNTLKRSSDFIFRMGGEEFAVIIIEQNDKDDCQVIAQKIVDDIQNLNIPHPMNKPYGVVTVSLGAISTIAQKELTIDHLYKQSDILLYKSKTNGKNQYTTQIE